MIFVCVTDAWFAVDVNEIMCNLAIWGMQTVWGIAEDIGLWKGWLEIKDRKGFT
jgi:hypothetical protein